MEFFGKTAGFFRAAMAGLGKYSMAGLGSIGLIPGQGEEPSLQA